MNVEQEEPADPDQLAFVHAPLDKWIEELEISSRLAAIAYLWHRGDGRLD